MRIAPRLPSRHATCPVQRMRPIRPAADRNIAPEPERADFLEDLMETARQQEEAEAEAQRHKHFSVESLQELNLLLAGCKVAHAHACVSTLLHSLHACICISEVTRFCLIPRSWKSWQPRPAPTAQPPSSWMKQSAATAATTPPGMQSCSAKATTYPSRGGQCG